MTASIPLSGIPEPKDFFRSEPEHPLLPLPSMAQVRALVASQGEDGLRKLLAWRRQKIAEAEAEPLNAPRPKHWRIADRLRRGQDLGVLVLLGGNRSTKSYYCADALMRAVLRAREHNRKHGVRGLTTFLVGSDSEANSKLITQPLVWHFLPQTLKQLNNVRTRREKAAGIDINYSPGDGFADRVLTLGFGTVINFILYSNDPGNYEGGEFGPKDYADVAWWMDEDLTLPWYNMLRRRGRYRPGHGLWSFTPIRGITSTIKEAVGTGRVIRTRTATLLPKNLPLVRGLGPGRVPFVQQGSDAGVRVVYFHSDLTPFGSGGHRYADTVAADCAGRPTDYTLRIYYGYTEDITGKAFPRYTRQVHWIPPEALPWDGTNYVFMDPADRNWFLIWVRVAPGSPRRLFVYRDWPDKRRYDAWAVPTSKKISADSRRGMDGDAGPAQRSQGWGVPRYKRLMLAEETIEARIAADGRPDHPDPYRRHRLNLAMREVGLKPVKEWQGYGGVPECAWRPEQLEEFRRLHPDPVREAIRLRKIDPRAAANPQQSTIGRVTLLDLLAREDRNPKTGELEAPVMVVLPASTGKGIDDGITHVNELLDYDERQPICPVINEPKLYVSAACEQVDWMFQNYTGEGGEDGACKDPADLIRYVAQDEDLRHIEPGGKLKTGGFHDGF